MVNCPPCSKCYVVSGFFSCFLFSLYSQKKTADDFVASNEEESDDEGVENEDEEGKKVKKPKVKKERKR